MLEVRDLTVRYGSGADALTAVRGVSFAIPDGDTMALVGEFGSGKSTVAKAIIGMAPVVSGTIVLDGKPLELGARAGRELNQQIQMVFQDPYSSLNPRMTIRAMLTEAVGARAKRVSRAGRDSEVVRALQMVGLSEQALERYPHQFSGGQRQRIAIARALAVQPRFLLLDEVTSSLDVSVQATILNMLRRLQRDLGLSYLFISHDLSVVRIMSNVVGVLYLGAIMEQGPSSALLKNPGHPYTRVLLASVPSMDEPRQKTIVFGELPDPRRPPAGCLFHTRCPIGPLTYPERAACLESDPRSRMAYSEDRLVACHFAGSGSEHETPKSKETKHYSDPSNSFSSTRSASGESLLRHGSESVRPSTEALPRQSIASER